LYIKVFKKYFIYIKVSVEGKFTNLGALNSDHVKENFVCASIQCRLEEEIDNDKKENTAILYYSL